MSEARLHSICATAEASYGGTRSDGQAIPNQQSSSSDEVSTKSDPINKARLHDICATAEASYGGTRSDGQAISSINEARLIFAPLKPAMARTDRRSN
jgi:hypothetical protein